MEYNISDAVEEIVLEMHFLRFAFKEDLINYSALARFIKPLVEERVGEHVGLDAIVMALKKHSPSLSSQPFNIFGVFKEARLLLRTGVCLIHFERTEELHKKLVEFQRNIDWAAGEKLYLLQRSEEISIVALSKYEGGLLSLAAPGQVLKKYSNLAVVTVQFPEEYFDTYGVFEYLANQFTDVGVSIKEVFSSHDKVSLVFDEDKASLVYEKLSKAVEASRQLSELQGKKKQEISVRAP
ncbi:MAG: hypothetical protein V1717_02385 [Candidatus Micrarchaeota archaeon]